MKAMILAAGKGTRVRPVTHAVPKPMIPIIDRPVLEHLVDHLRRHGFDEIVVNTSHLAHHIENYFRDGSRFGVQMAYSFEGYLENGEIHGVALGSAGGLKRIQDHSGFFDDTFLVLCGDALIDLDLTAFLAEHKRRGALASIAMKKVPADRVSSYGIVVTGEDGRIREFQEKPAPDEAKSTTANTGIYLFEPEVMDRIPTGREYDIGGELFPKLVEEGAPFFGTDLPFEWIDIGTLADYVKTVQHALHGRITGVAPTGRKIAPGVFAGLNVALDLDRCEIVGPVWIGGSARIETGSTIIGPSVIGAGCVVEAGARIERSIVFDYTRIGSAANIIDSVVTGDFCADPSGTTIDIKRAGIEWAVNDARADAPFVPDEFRSVGV